MPRRKIESSPDQLDLLTKWKVTLLTPPISNSTRKETVMIAKDYLEEKLRRAVQNLESMQGIIARCPHEITKELDIENLQEYLKYTDQHLNSARNELNKGVPNQTR